MIKKLFKMSLIGSALLLSSCREHKELKVKIFNTQSNDKIGTITFRETRNGLLITPELTNLPSGIHGFHIHQHASCEDHGMSAAGHFDPQNTNKHLGPYNNNGHLGDLPALYVDKDGKTQNLAMLAPRIKSIDTIKNHAIMIHAGGDNYSDTPEKLGGGGARIGCGVIQ